MQGCNVKYLKKKNGELLLFYHEEDIIFCRTWRAGVWSQKEVVEEGVFEHFSIAQRDEELYLLSITKEKRLVLAKKEVAGDWKKKVLLQDGTAFLHTTFFMVPWKTSFYLIYHQPMENTGLHHLFCVGFEDGKWSSPKKIDQCLPMQGAPYVALTVGEGHIMLYYRTQRNMICARELLLSPFTLGSVVPVIHTPYPCAELSLLQDSQKVHQLYIVKGIMRCQVVYQYKQASVISTPRVIWQDGNCEKCIVYRIKDRLYLMWNANGQTYRCFSQDNGGHFHAVERMILPMPRGCVKGTFLLPSQTEDFFATEAFGDAEKGYEMYYFPQFTAKTEENIVAMQKEKEVESEDISAKTLENEIQQLQMILEKREEELAQTNMQWKRNIAEFSLANNKLKEQLKEMLEERKQILEERSLFQKRLELSEGERSRLKKTVEHLERKCKEVEEAVRLEVAEKIN